MTANGNIKIKEKDKRKRAIFVLSAWCALLFSILISKKISGYANDGLSLCANTVIASVFPFLILTDLILSSDGLENIKVARCLFERIFKVNGYAINAFIIGVSCGFPIGVKVAAELYKNEKISKEECERLIGFVNNTGPAFIISGVGIGMRGSISDGIILYFSMVISAVVVGALFGIRKSYKAIPAEKNAIPFDFSSSVKSAAYNTLSICGFVVLFSIVCGILSDFIKTDIALTLVLPFIEITNATQVLSKMSFIPELLSIALTSFAISFSGLSVHLQASSFLRDAKISMKKYYLMKISQGIISAIVTAVIFSFL